MLKGLRMAREALAALTCPTCGKRRAVLNTAGHRQRYTPEPVSAETHCACPGGPAHALTPSIPSEATRGSRI
jgi:hypothetical protein